MLFIRTQRSYCQLSELHCLLSECFGEVIRYPIPNCKQLPKRTNWGLSQVKHVIWSSTFRAAIFWYHREEHFRIGESSCSSDTQRLLHIPVTSLLYTKIHNYRLHDKKKTSKSLTSECLNFKEGVRLQFHTADENKSMGSWLQIFSQLCFCTDSLNDSLIKYSFSH